MMMEDTEETQCLLSAESDENVASSEHSDSSDERSKEGAGWYAWLVVLCSFTCVCILDGIGYSFGVFFETLLRDLSGGQGRGVLSIAGGLQVTTIFLSFRSDTVTVTKERPGCSKIQDPWT